jgi:signal transduction histidine kinase
MRSLFAKILLWFLAVMAITVAGMVVTTAHTYSATRGRDHIFGRMIGFELEESRHAYETNGREGLAHYLDRFRTSFQAQGVLTDGQGRDLLTGENHRDLVASVTTNSRWPFFLRPAVIGRESRDGAYWFFILAPRDRPGFALFSAEYLWIVGIVVLLSYLLALHVTSPVRKLDKAVEAFGAGDLSLRMRSVRRDEFGQLARTFDHMADRIGTLLTAERRLLLDISHELRSPLARLSVAIELARSGEDGESALNRIQKEADRLNVLVGQLLQVTRAEGDPSSLHFETVRLDELLREVAGDVAIEAEARGSRVEVKSAPPVTVHGDAELLRRALENVIRNGVLHTPPDTAVEISMEAQDGKSRTTIRDYGLGVPEEHLPHIFDPFYRVETDRNRSSGGVGLGLSIARRAIELHKGRITAANASPGLAVEIVLPVASRGSSAQAGARDHAQTA